MATDPNDIADIAHVQTEMQAEILAEMLRSEGIETQTAGGITGGFRAEAPGSVRLLVHQRDAARAKQLLEDARRGTSPAVNWSTINIRSD